MLKHERENLLSFTSDVNDSNTQESLFKKSAEGVSSAATLKKEVPGRGGRAGTASLSGKRMEE